MSTKTKRAPKAKTASAPKSAPTKGFSLSNDMISKPIDSGKVEFRVRKASEKYQHLIGQVLDMNEGQTVLVSIPKEKAGKPESFKASIAATLTKRVADKIDGRLRFRLTLDGKVAISLVPLKG
jgi:hypothetical protein